VVSALLSGRRTEVSDGIRMYQEACLHFMCASWLEMI